MREPRLQPSVRVSTTAGLDCQAAHAQFYCRCCRLSLPSPHYAQACARSMPRHRQGDPPRMHRPPLSATAQRPRIDGFPNRKSHRCAVRLPAHSAVSIAALAVSAPTRTRVRARRQNQRFPWRMDWIPRQECSERTTRGRRRPAGLCRCSLCVPEREAAHSTVIRPSANACVLVLCAFDSTYLPPMIRTRLRGATAARHSWRCVRPFSPLSQVVGHPLLWRNAQPQEVAHAQRVRARAVSSDVVQRVSQLVERDWLGASAARHYSRHRLSAATTDAARQTDSTRSGTARLSQSRAHAWVGTAERGRAVLTLGEPHAGAAVRASRRRARSTGKPDKSAKSHPKPSEKKDQAQQHRSAKGTENYTFQTDPSDLLDLLECILAERDVGKLQRAVFEHYS